MRGALLPSGRRAVVVADMERRRDPSFGAWLVLVDPGHDNRVLAKGCAHASRPWVLPSGRVLVQRGVPGPEVDPASAQGGELRTDALSVDEVDPEERSAAPAAPVLRLHHPHCRHRSRARCCCIGSPTSSRIWSR